MPKATQMHSTTSAKSPDSVGRFNSINITNQKKKPSSIFTKKRGPIVK